MVRREEHPVLTSSVPYLAAATVFRETEFAMMACLLLCRKAPWAAKAGRCAHQ
jgi:hypothetical protein